jgi:hypothetical protein
LEREVDLRAFSKQVVCCGGGTQTFDELATTGTVASPNAPGLVAPADAESNLKSNPVKVAGCGGSGGEVAFSVEPMVSVIAGANVGNCGGVAAQNSARGARERERGWYGDDSEAAVTAASREESDGSAAPF